MDPAFVPAPSPAAMTFEDGLGQRLRVVDPMRNEPVEMLCLRGELTAVPAFEFALRERVGRLAAFRHPCYAGVHSVERLKDRASTLALVSDSTVGVRLSEVLAFAEREHVTLDIDAAVCLLRQLVPAAAMLHEHAPDIAHGALALERLVITPGSRVVIVEHVLGSALEQLRFSHERYWKELRLALPRSAGAPRFDHRADVTQIGVIALSLILGRPLADDEYPARIGDVVASAWAISARGGLEPLPAGFRAWLTRALQLDSRNWFRSAVEAQADLERVLGESDYLAAPASLDTFMAAYHAATAAAQPAEVAQPAAPEPITIHAPVVAPAPVVTLTPVASPAPAVAPVPVVAQAAAAVHAPVVAHTPIAEPIAARPNPAPVVAQSAPQPTAAPVLPDLAQAFVAEIRHQPAVDSPLFASSSTPPPPAPAPALAPVAAASRPAVAPPIVAPAPQAAYKETALPSATHDPLPSPHRRELPKRGASRRNWQLAAAAAAVIAVAAAGIPAARRYVTPAKTSADGTLNVTTNPPGAHVFVDGVERGATPLTIALKPGPHAMELRGDGAPRTMPITITAGGQLAQYIDLPKSAATLGQLHVRTEPAGARVSVDGVARGTSPTTVADLTPGEHAVLLESDLGSVKQTVSIEAGVTASLTVPLTAAAEGVPVSGWIAITAPADVQVFENKRLLGTSQSDRLMVGAGRHDLEIANDTLGYRTTRTVQVAPGRVTPIRIDFPKGTIALNAIPWAEVWVDGAKVGDTPIGNLQLTIGAHEIVFRNPDLGEQRHAATITVDTPARLSVDLRKK
ncbi:MAG TPA: PEGA domain-containing protein [Vicinamibacterales bacterium]|nr:PEGA domain-containing protein [Vicinamibacterales bacterium]